jgi:hypothetical protein
LLGRGPSEGGGPTVTVAQGVGGAVFAANATSVLMLSQPLMGGGSITQVTAK